MLFSWLHRNVLASSVVMDYAFNTGRRPEAWCYERESKRERGRENTIQTPDHLLPLCCSPSCLGVTVDTLSRPPLKLLGIWLKCMFSFINPACIYIWLCVARSACMAMCVLVCIYVMALAWIPRAVKWWDVWGYACGDVTVPGQSGASLCPSICGPSVPSLLDLWLSLGVTWQGYLSHGPLSLRLRQTWYIQS